MKRVALIKKRRICKFPNCKHVLSIYNPEIYCYVHQRTAEDKKPHQLSSTR